MPGPVVEFGGVGVTRSGRALLAEVDWTVRPGERWAVLGPNGSGKTTLLRVAGLWLRPTAGSVRLLGHESGRTDVRRLRGRIGFTSQSLADQLRADIDATTVVMTARNAALEGWWHRYDDADRDRAVAQLDRVGASALAERPYGTLSAGERQRVLLARALAADSGLLLLDEPAAGLDLGGREDLVDRLRALAADASTPPIVLVTHHSEEIPEGWTHALLLREGRTVAAGAIDDVITDEPLSVCFGLDLAVDGTGGRWHARRRRSSSPPGAR